jgi:hypothetical protein
MWYSAIELKFSYSICIYFIRLLMFSSFSCFFSCYLCLLLYITLLLFLYLIRIIFCLSSVPEFLATDPKFPGSILGPTRFSEE